ncbi:MAG: peptidoglycan-binding protein [Candidatus Sericytochromatia bacterium]|nr:peptidoglycan-binding protein [Candidatus Sericytochromatia bacterium]
MISGTPGGSPNPQYGYNRAGMPAQPGAPGQIPGDQNLIQQQPPAVAPQGAGDVFASIVNGIVSLFRGIFNWIAGLFGKPATPPAQPTQPGQPALSPEEQALATQYKLWPSRENILAFRAEVASYQQQQVIGPGSGSPEAVRDLQTALARLGYPLQANGQFDAATADAVMRFKRDNGIQQNYRSADGQWAINEYVEPRTMQAILARLQGSPAPQPQPQPTPQPQPVPQPPATPGATDFQAVARQYGLLATAENVQAFLTEVKGYEAGGALGPGTSQKQAVADLQAALRRLGFAAPDSKTWDDATGQAVIAYKKARGIKQSYKAADGQWAINEYADPNTLASIMRELSALATQPAPTNPAPVPPAPVTPAPVPPVAPTQPTQPPATPGATDFQAVARQYGLLATAENVQAFLSEVKGYEAEGTLGPGTGKADGVRDLQTALTRLGFPVAVTGQYDGATIQAVISFKRAEGLRQTYKAADGQWAINEYASPVVLQRLIQKLQAAPAAPVVPQAPMVPQAPIQPPTQPQAPFVPSPAPSAPPVNPMIPVAVGSMVPSTGSPAPTPTPSRPAANPMIPVADSGLVPSTTPPSAPMPSTPSGGIDARQQALANQYGLLATAANVAAFEGEIRSYTQDGTLGPGSPQTDAIRDLQAALGRLGYAVSPSGQYDGATAQAVIAFKRANGISQRYLAANGQPAVNEYADRRTLEVVMQRLQATLR